MDECVAALREGNLLWCAPLVHALDEKQHGLAFLWVMRCVRRLLVLTGSPKAETLLVDVDILEEMSRVPPSQEEIIEMALSIWYRPDRDFAQTAVSKLVGLLADQQGAGHPGYYDVAMTAPINNFVFSWETNAPDEKLSEIVLAEFKAIAEEYDVTV